MKNIFFVLILLFSTQHQAFSADQSQTITIPDSLELMASIGDNIMVLATHTIYKVFDDNKKRRIKECTSTPTSPCLEDLVPGNYLIKTVIKDFKKKTYIEIKSGELNKINIKLGQTGEVEITASDREQGQRVTAFHKILRKGFGDNYKHKISCSSSLEKACLNELPVGEYLLKSASSGSKQETLFKIIEGETTIIHIIFSSPE